jgi:hypothetical protein
VNPAAENSKTPSAAIGRLFISHSSADDSFVRDLRDALALHGEDGWIDSREMRGGDLLWTQIKKAIDQASAYAVVVSPSSLQSDWVGDELEYVMKLQRARVKVSSASSHSCSTGPSWVCSKPFLEKNRFTFP